MTVQIPTQDIMHGLVSTDSCPAIWETLAGTPGVGIALIRCDGKYLYCSSEFKRMFLGDAAAPAEGKTILDLFPADWARERLQTLARIEAGEPRMVLREIWRGRQMLTRVGSPSVAGGWPSRRVRGHPSGQRD